MATGQGFFFALLAAAPNRPDGVNHVPGSQSPSRSGDCLACGQSPLTGDDGLAGFQNRRTTGAMDGAVDTASAHEGGVRSVHDGVAGFARDVARTLDDEQAVGGNVKS